MRLDAMKRSQARRPVYSVPLADEDGHEHYELSISGPQKLVEKIFEKTDFEAEIAPKVTPEEYEERSRAVWKKRMQEGATDSTPIDAVAAKFAKRRPAPSPALPTKDSVLVHLRRTEGTGTFYALWLPVLVLPPGLSVYFFLPRVWATWSGTLPYSGNPNLYLAVVPPPTSALWVSTSTLPPAALPVADGVSYATAPLPWTHFTPMHVVVNAAPGGTYTVTHYVLVGHSLTLF
jgi:hypothetical protein